VFFQKFDCISVVIAPLHHLKERVVKPMISHIGPMINAITFFV
jgi:hypothetical protein